MSSVKALPLGQVSSQMYVVMDRPNHEVNSSYKRVVSVHHQASPPGSYPYSTSSPTTSSSHMVGAPHYATANHIYREAHFQVDGRPPTENNIDRYGEHQVRRRLTLRPAPDYNTAAALERERSYMDAIRYQYEREATIVPFNPNVIPSRHLKPPVVSVHTPPSDLETPQAKRPRLAVEPKPPVHTPLLIDTRLIIKKEPTYMPQVEAISPTLPSEEGRCDSPVRSAKDIAREKILQEINRVDKEISGVEAHITKLDKKLLEVKAEATEPSTSTEPKTESFSYSMKSRSLAQNIIAENKTKAIKASKYLHNISIKINKPLYNQPQDTTVYQENKKKFLKFRPNLLKFLKKRHKERYMRQKYLAESYSKLQTVWQKKVEKKENNTTKKSKDAKLREFFEKIFPELRKQREDKERISRVSTRVRSESEWEEIIDGLQEQELEEKKTRNYAVSPPMCRDPRITPPKFLKLSNLVTEPEQLYKDMIVNNTWTEREKATFTEKYLMHPKSFWIISTALPVKTVSDCVKHYYMSKKNVNYKQMLRKHNVRKRTRALARGSQVQPTVPTSIILPQNPQNSSIITRQHEDSRSLISSCSRSATSNTETTTLAAIPDSQATTSSLPEPGTSATEAQKAADSAPEVPADPSASDISGAPAKSAQDLSKHLLPNNIRKKKEAAQMMEKGEDSDTASDQQNVNAVSQPCAICKTAVDNVNQSRPLTKSNCSMFGLKESDITEEMRVCVNCRFKSVRKRCPIPTCKTLKRKVKRLRPLPTRLAELPKETKDAIYLEFQIPADVTKCCSACFNRITRKFESSTDLESAENLRWTDEEMTLAKEGLRKHGADWDALSNVVSTKNREQCKAFYFNFRQKFGLEEILREYKKEKGEDDSKPPPTLTDEEESGETTSSCDEDDRADRCSSDTASAPSPGDKVLIEDKNTSQTPASSEPSQLKSTLLNHSEPRPRLAPNLNASPKGLPDYDSSATASAAEDEDGEGRDLSPHPMLHAPNHMKMPMEHPKKAFQYPYSKSIESRTFETSIPLVKTLLQDPKIGAPGSGQHDGAISLIQEVKSKEEPTCVRDLIYQAIEMSLQHPKPSKNGPNQSTPFPGILGALPQELYPVESKKDVYPPESKKDVYSLESKKDVYPSESKKEAYPSDAKKDGESLIPPLAHGGNSRHPSRPSSQHMEVAQDCEVQDLSKKVKSRDASPVREFQKRLMPVRPQSASSTSPYYYGGPPPAHSNPYRSSQPPPPALSPHYVADPHHDQYYTRGGNGGESRGKTYIITERPHSQPPHLVAQSSSMASPSTIPAHPKPIPIKATTVPPIPPLVASKPSQMSPKLIYKDRPAGSITQGTPVNQQPIQVQPSASRYENFLRLPSPQSKDGGSIIHGTPVPHDIIKRVTPNSRPEVFAQNHTDNLVRQAVPAMYDPSVIEYYRQSGQPYAFAPGYPGYPPGSIPQRPPYANSESKQSSNQLVIDFNTSKQMQMHPRRGGNGIPEKEMKASPRGNETSPNSQESHLHPMYPPSNYQGSGPHYNHVPAGYQPTDSRYIRHRSPSSQIDRTRSPSRVESPVNGGYSHHPGKQSPNLPMPGSRQNVIHRSITWGTGKPSVIQAPQSASPRTSDMRTETVSPANMRKSTPSPRHPQPMPYPPSGHDAFNTLVNAAVAQPSLVVPKDGKRSPSTPSHLEVKSPRDRPVVEGLEKTLIDMHQRPRSYTESGHPQEREMRPDQINEGHRYPGGSYEMSKERVVDKHAMSNDRLGPVREPFSREHFERQMRQNSTAVSKDRLYPKKEDERSRSGPPEVQNYSNPPQQSELDNEASKIFSQSFQKDAPRSNSAPRGLTAATLIDAIITRQINQNVDVSSGSKISGIDIFNQYNSNYDDKSAIKPTKLNSRTEVVTIDDEPDEKPPSSWPERPNRGSPVPVSNANITSYSNDKVYTLNEHIAAIISKDYNSPTDPGHSQTRFSPSSTNASNPKTSSAYVMGTPSNSNSGKPNAGLMPMSPSEVSIVNSSSPLSISDHNNWKLRRALQQDREADHRSPGLNEPGYKRPSSGQSSDASIPQEERQIIRVAQTSSPQSVTRSSPAGPYAVEPISPPSSHTNENEVSNRTISALQHSSPVWGGKPRMPPGLIAVQHMYPHEYPEGVSAAAAAAFNGPQPASSSSPPRVNSRPSPQQQQMGLSPLDYVTNRIVEVMRTATDSEPESSENHRPQSAMSHSDEREHQIQQVYRYPPEREVPSERPLSNGPSTHQGHRYSPAMSRYSPVPPRPSSAVERVPSRNSTPVMHKRTPDGHEWRDGQSVSSRASSRSVSPSGGDHPDASTRKKTRTEGTFVPESTTDRAPVLLPQNSISIHRSGSMSEAPRLGPTAHGVPEALSKPPHVRAYHPENDSKYRTVDGRSEREWAVVNNHGRDGESIVVDSYPPNRNDVAKHSAESAVRQGITNGPVSQHDASRNSPSQNQRPPVSTSGHYIPFGVAKSGNPGGSSLHPPMAYPNFSGISSTYAYPYSALSVRSMPTSAPLSNNNSNSAPAISSTYIPPVNNSPQNSSSPHPPRSNSNQPPPLLSSQYDPVSDED